MDTVIYVSIDGVIWKVTADGEWTEVSRADVPSTEEIIFLSAKQATEMRFSAEDEEGEQVTPLPPEVGLFIPDNVLDRVSQLNRSSANTARIQPSGDESPETNEAIAPDDSTVIPDSSTISDSSTEFNNAADLNSSGSLLTGYLAPTLGETLPDAGYQTRGILVRAESPLPVSENRFVLPESAILNVTILDGGDGYENRFETPAVTITGTTTEIRDGIAVTVTVSDINGKTVTVNGTIDNDAYQIQNVNLTALAEGELIAEAVVTDSLGQSISATDDTIKDTLAEISGNLEGFGDAVINFVEQSTEQINGEVLFIEDGQPIEITVSDPAGKSLSYSTVVSGNSWSINNVDLTPLQDGTLTVTATATDIAGNPAVSTETILKDTIAQLTILFEDGGDGIINIVESSNVTVFGAATGIENGQALAITLTDTAGAVLNVTAQVTNNGWSVSGLDLSGFAEGVISGEVSGEDLAGNPAMAATTTFAIDRTLPTIDIDTLTGFDILELRQGTLTPIQGTTTGVDEGLPVTIVLSDGTSEISFTTTVDGAGNWQMNALDASSLNESGVWTLTASVKNAIGNEASDDMPTLQIPGTMVLSETIVSLYGEDRQVADINIEGAAFTFSEQQAAMLKLESAGQLLSFTVSPDGSMITFTRADGGLVLEGRIINDQVEVILYDGLEALRSFDLQTELVIKGTQTDSDGTIEEVLAPVVLTVQDARPLVFSDEYQTVEAIPTAGNILNNDTDLDGGLAVRSVTVDGVTKNVVASAPVVFDLEEGLLTIFANGYWILDTARDLDHTQAQFVEFTYVAGDNDVDFGTTTALIDISDGATGNVLDGEDILIEGLYSQASTVGTETFIILGGSDNPDPNNVVFDPNTIPILSSLQLTSGNSSSPLSYTLSADGKTITASSDSTIVFTVVLSATASGNDVEASTQLTMFEPINQFSSADIVTLPFDVMALDTDGTPLASGQHVWVIADGSDPSISVINNIVINESELDVSPVVKTGQFSVVVGSDPFGNVFFDSSSLPTLSSEGVEVIYAVNAAGNELTAFQGDITGIKVFELSFVTPSGTQDETLDYTFTLYRALDQQNITDIIEFFLVARDSDSDKVVAAIDIEITDAPAGTITSDSLIVSETPKDPATPSAILASASGVVEVTASKDPIVNIALDVTNNEEVKDSLGNTLTHNNEIVRWRANADGSYDGIIADGTRIFKVTLPDDVSIAAGDSASVSISFQLVKQVDHLDPSQDTTLLLEVPVIVTDSDGTTQSTLTAVTIYDGLIVDVSIAGNLTADEDGLIADNEEDGVESNPPTLQLSSGSDNFSHYILDVAAFNLLGITSAGESVTLNDINSSDWYIANNASGQEVFRIQLLESGNVDFILSLPLDHQIANGENNLALDFSVAAVDIEGDQSAFQTFSVNVQDSVPVGRNISVEIVEGDSLSGNLLTRQSGGADGAEIISVEYLGVTYTSDPAGLTLINPFDGFAYGVLVINFDGSFELVTVDSVDNPSPIQDTITYVVRDGDGDEATSTATLILDDQLGFIRATDVEIREDESATLSITVIEGDLDQGEFVESISIDEASLQGGSIYLDGVLQTAVGGKITFNSSQIIAVGNDNFTVNGQITYQPPLHQSNTTISLVLGLSAVIATTTVPKNLSAELAVSVLPVADTPQWDATSEYTYDTIEDAELPVKFNINALLVDTDSSETLKYQITGIPEGITIYLNGKVIKETRLYSQTQLNKMEVVADENLAGVFEFNLAAIATEAGNNFFQPEDETAVTSQLITINIAPDADEPTLSVRDINGLEDEMLNLSQAINGKLFDVDSSEELFYEIVVADGWSVQGTGITLVAPNTYLVAATDIEAGTALLIPKQDISSVTEALSVDVTAVAVESVAGGVNPVNYEALSATKTINIRLKGVVDAPELEDSALNSWAFDQATSVISNIVAFDEGSLLPLDFLLKTGDDDLSEAINILLTDIPDNTEFVDANGDPVTLNIAKVDPVTGIVVQLTNEDLQNIKLKADKDFSGELQMKGSVVSTEPDGDSGTFEFLVKIEVAPVVDEESGQSLMSSGVEDRGIVLNLTPTINADTDGSETLENYYIDRIDNGLTLYYQGVALDVPPGGLDLSTLLDATVTTLDDLLAGSQLEVRGDADLSGNFTLDLRYTVLDTSETGMTAVKELTATAQVQIDGVVEFDTRLEATTRLLESTDGSPIDLSEAVWFVEEDVDGSEYLDYIVIVIPEGDTLIVEHPNGAERTASGDWIIDADGLTADNVQESMAMLLGGATIRSTFNTDILQVGVRARVLDEPDAELITTQFSIRITGHGGGGGGGCDPVGTPDDIQNSGVIQFNEGEPIDLSGLLNTNVASDPDNFLSFYIPADSLPEGVYLEGDDIIVEYNGDGTVAGYSITQSALASLTLLGVDEDFAGCVEFTISTVETSSCNGSKVTTDNTIRIEIAPVVDDFIIRSPVTSINEDTIADLNLELILGDSVEEGQLISGEGALATGKESVLSMIITVPAGVVLSDNSGESSYLVDNGNNTYSILDPTRLGDISVTPPANFSGELTFLVTATIMDEADCVTKTDTQTKTSQFSIYVEPVADSVILTSTTFSGDEDAYISLAALSAELIDQDGSESLSLTIKGGPTGAILALKVGNDYQLLPNNGQDGGTFNGQPTYEWQIDPELLADIYMLPPLDFSGQINMVLEAITQEVENTDIQYTTTDFIVGVFPVGDDIQFFDVPDTITGSEDDAIVVPVNLSSKEINSNETIRLKVTINADSDATALTGLGEIRVGSQEAFFTANGDGSWSATLIIAASTLASFELLANNAFGQMNVTIEANTIDSATVLGVSASDEGNIATQDLIINVTPEPDPPILELTYEQIVAESDGTIPLGLNMTLVNSTMVETGTLSITGLPGYLTLSHGTLDGSAYLVDSADVADLAITGGYVGAESFSLIIEAITEVEGVTLQSPLETLDIELVEVGDSTLLATNQSDLLQGGAGADNFTYTSGVLGSTEAPGYDVISDFEFTQNSDSIDVSAVFDNLGLALDTGVKAESYIELSESGSGVEVGLKSDGVNVDQKIVLSDITLSDLYGSDASMASQAEILQQMIDDQNLVATGVP